MSHVFENHPQNSIKPMKSRGAGHNPHNRFHPRRIETVADDWYQEATAYSIATEVTDERARSIISHNRSPDVPFESSINPYRGCEHGCIYCFARPSHAYWDLSPGLDFETRLIAKPNAAALLRETLCKPRYRCRPIALGVNTDAYQPLERERRITRGLLEVLLEARHPVSIITKSALILRDLDLLAALSAHQLCSVRISLTTLDNDLKAKMEPRAAGPAARLRCIRELTGAGIPTGILLAPVIPFINDTEIERILEKASQSGALRADWVLLRLPREVVPLFTEWLETHFPQRADRVLNRMKDLRGGQLYQSDFGRRMVGSGPYAELIRQRFRSRCLKLGLNRSPEPPLRTDLFRAPAAQMPLL